MTIWNRLTLWAAGSPKGEGEQLALEAVEELERLKQRVAELAYAKEQLELRVLDLIMTRAKNALVTLTDAEREQNGAVESRETVPITNLDAVPAAKSAEPESSVPLGSGAELAHTQEPVAWAVMQPDSYSVFASRTLAEKMRELCAGGEIVPLYRQPPLTDAEREAINDAVYLCGATAGRMQTQANATGWATCAATLRSLLERTK